MFGVCVPACDQGCGGVAAGIGIREGESVVGKIQKKWG
jgi:hypothetical protein